MDVKKYVGVEGVDKTVDRRMLELMIAHNAGNLGAPIGGGKTLLQATFDNVSAVVQSMAACGYLTPEEISSSPTLNAEIQRELRDAEAAEAKRKANIEEARAASEAALKAAKAAAEKSEAAAAAADNIE